MKTQAPELLVSSTVNLTGEPEGTTRQGHPFDEDVQIEQGQGSHADVRQEEGEFIHGRLSVVEAPMVTTSPRITQSNLYPRGTNSYHSGMVSRWQLNKLSGQAIYGEIPRHVESVKAGDLLWRGGYRLEIGVVETVVISTNNHTDNLASPQREIRCLTIGAGQRDHLGISGSPRTDKTRDAEQACGFFVVSRHFRRNN